MIPSDDTKGYVAGRERPSHKELWKKRARALDLVKDGNWIPSNPEKLKRDFDELEGTFGIETATFEDQAEAIINCLREIRPRDYVGNCPPRKSTDLSSAGLEMFIFKWSSPSLCNAVMYIKFSLIGKGDKGPAYLQSLHPDHPNDPETRLTP